METVSAEAEGPETTMLTAIVLSATITPEPRSVLCRLIVEVIGVELTGGLVPPQVEDACTVNVTCDPAVATLLPGMAVGYVTKAAAAAPLSRAKGVPPVAPEPTVTVT